MGSVAWRRLPALTDSGSGHFWWSTDRRSSRREDATAQHIEIGAAEHLTLEHLQPVEVPFDRP